MRNPCFSQPVSVVPLRHPVLATLRVVCILLTVCGALLLAGCARWPEGPIVPVGPAHTLAVDLTVAGVIDPGLYYFVAIDADGNTATGPVPDATGLGNGWGILAPTPSGQPVQAPPFYVQYHNGVFQQVLNGNPVGQPYAYSVTGSTLSMEIDLSLLGDPIPPSIQINLITQQDLTMAPADSPITKSFDGLGAHGGDYLFDFRLDVAHTLVGNDPGAPQELAYGQMYAGGSVEDTTTTPNLDMIGWRMEVRNR
jgi:hypothetical protein